MNKILSASIGLRYSQLVLLISVSSLRIPINLWAPIYLDIKPGRVKNIKSFIRSEITGKYIVINLIGDCIPPNENYIYELIRKQIRDEQFLPVEIVDKGCAMNLIDNYATKNDINLELKKLSIAIGSYEFNDLVELEDYIEYE